MRQWFPSWNKLPETHCSLPGSGEDRKAGKNPYVRFQVWWKPPLTSHYYRWAPTTVAEESGSKCKMTLLLAFLKALNALQHTTRQQLKEHETNYQVSLSQSQKPTSITSTCCFPLSHHHFLQTQQPLLLSKKAFIPYSRFIWSPSELKIHSSKKSELCHFLQLRKLELLKQSLS